MPVRILRLWQAVPGHAEPLATALTGLMERLKGAPGVLEARLFQDRLTVGSFLGIGVFESEAALLWSGPQAYLAGLAGVEAAHATLPSTLHQLRTFYDYRHPQRRAEWVTVSQYRVLTEQVEAFPVAYKAFLEDLLGAWDLVAVAFGQTRHNPTAFFSVMEWARADDLARYLASDFRHVKGRARYGAMLEEEPRRFDLAPLWEYRAAG